MRYAGESTNLTIGALPDEPAQVQAVHFPGAERWQFGRRARRIFRPTAIGHTNVAVVSWAFQGLCVGRQPLLRFVIDAARSRVRNSPCFEDEPAMSLRQNCQISAPIQYRGSHPTSL
jgi:hypothetical protein